MLARCCAVLIDTHGTEKKQSRHGLEALGPYDDPGLLAQRGQQFSKRKNGLVANAMRWEDLERTDLGEALQAFLKL